MSEFLSSSELFINVKNPPVYNPKKHFFDQTPDVIQFYTEELEKIQRGVNIGGYHLHPWLYWHINFFKTPIPTADKKEILTNPPLDDNFLYVIENYSEAEELNKGLALFGARGVTKSSLIASLSTWLSTCKDNGVVAITGGSDPDLKTVARLIKAAHGALISPFRVPAMIANWDKQVSFGIKEDAQTPIHHSYITITNADPSKKTSTEKGAGGSPIGYVLDEALHEDSTLYYEGYEGKIKDAKIGEYIYGSDGKLTKILDKVDPGIVDTYRITLSDGRSVVCSGNHLWTVYNTYKKTWETKTLDKIREKYYYEKYDKRYDKTVKSLVYSIPQCNPLEYPSKDLKIDPYWLGLFLGDGLCGTTSVCSIDDEIIQYCEKYATKLGMNFKTVHPKSVPNLDFRVTSITKLNGTKKNPLLNVMRDYGIGDTKTIPSDFLYGSYEQRLDLLAGILDTDGSRDRRNNISFSTSFENFAVTFEKLVRSLGISVKKTSRVSHYRDKNGNKVSCKMSYRFTFFTDVELFRLNRKKNNRVYQESHNLKKRTAYQERITIKDIEYIGKNQVYCIKVSNASKLFITDNFIVTHNCGKFEFLKTFESAIPSFETPYGYKLVPLLAGTSGNAELSRDAKKLLSNPDAYNMLPMDWERLKRISDPDEITWTNSLKDKFGVFFPGQMSYRLNSPKRDSNLSEYLKVESKELEKIAVKSTNWKLANEKVQEKIDKAADEEGRGRIKMYYPREIADVWLTTAKNPFPAAIIDRHLRKLVEEGKGGKPVEFYKEDGKQKFEFSAKKPAPTYYDGGVVDSPILLFGSLPEQPPFKYIYVGGLDSYKLDGAASEGSLGAYYVIKRRSLEANEPCERIVLAYAARPERQREFNDNCMQGMKVFNAVTNIESIDLSYQQYLDDRGLADEYLCPAFRFSSSHDHKQPQLNSKYGLYPSTQNNDFRIRYLIEWCKEEHVVGMDEEGLPIIKYGVEFIEDIELLREMMEYKPGGNYDRIAAFSHALVYARELDRKEVFPERKKDLTEEIRRVKTNNLNTRNPYGAKRYNPYR